MTSPQPGQVIKGKYRIDRVLGEGGMGVVVAAHHVALDQRVAIKFLLPAMLSHPDIVDRFAREARAASKIESEHVARVMDVDTFEDGSPFMVMEYLEGGDLSSVRQSGTALAPHVAVDYILQACEAIGEAHRLGIVHRDLKPANLFLARKGDGRSRVKVLDFGISKMSSAIESVTKTTAVMGSCEYMSPEQMLSSRDADVRSDIWALGVTLYELVTAHVPFPGETITQVCALVMEARPTPPRAFAPQLPPGLEQIILRCLARDRNYRFSSVGELAAALLPFSPSSYAAPRSSSGIYDPVSYGGQGPMPSSPGFAVGQSNPHAAGFALAQSNPHVGPNGPITNAIVSRTSPSVGKSRAWLYATIFGMLGIGVIAGFFVMRGKASDGASTASSASGAAAEASPPAPSAVAATAAATAAAASASPTVAPAEEPPPAATAEATSEASAAPEPPHAAANANRGPLHHAAKPADKPAPAATTAPAAKPRNLGF